MLDFSGHPVVKTLCFHCRGLGLIPGQGTKIAQAAAKSSHATTKDPAMLGLPWWFSGKESTCQCRRDRFDP